RIARAVGDIRTIGNDIYEYDIVTGNFPASLAVIGYDTHLDPWGNPYQYLNFDDANGHGGMRKDRFLVPINSHFDLYSEGADGRSVAPLTAPQSQDDIIWANDGDFIGLASNF